MILQDDVFIIVLLSHDLSLLARGSDIVSTVCDKKKIISKIDNCKIIACISTQQFTRAREGDT